MAPAVVDAASPAATPTPAALPPASGVGSVTRVQLSAAGETATQCMAEAADGAVWVLETGVRSQLVRVGVDRAVSTFPIPGSHGLLGGGSQCLTIAADGGIWIARLDPSSIARFDPV